MTEEKKTEPIHVSIRIYDKKDNFVAFLSNISNAHNCRDGVSNAVRRIYQNYIDSNASQVYSSCRIFFVYPSRNGIDYTEWGRDLDIHSKKFEPLKKSIMKTLFESFGDGIVRNYND